MTIMDAADLAEESRLRRARARAVKGLYVIADPEHTRGRPLLEIAEAALRGGASAIQLRDKRSNKGPLLGMARSLKSLCARHGALFIVNDDADIALLSKADGLHVGQCDLPVEEARRVLAPEQIIGTSNAVPDEASESETRCADYIAVGAIYDSSTKTKTRPAGIEVLRQVKKTVGVPVVAIGGINRSNAEAVIKAGADSVCVISAVTMAEDPEEAARELVQAIRSARGT